MKSTVLRAAAGLAIVAVAIYGAVVISRGVAVPGTSIAAIRIAEHRQRASRH